jgi:hypothetical protein
MTDTLTAKDLIKKIQSKCEHLLDIPKDTTKLNTFLCWYIDITGCTKEGREKEFRDFFYYLDMLQTRIDEIRQLALELQEKVK